MTRKKPVGCSRLDEVTQSRPRYSSAQLQIQIQTVQLQCIQSNKYKYIQKNIQYMFKFQKYIMNYKSGNLWVKPAGIFAVWHSIAHPHTLGGLTATNVPHLPPPPLPVAKVQTEIQYKVSNTNTRTKAMANLIAKIKTTQWVITATTVLYNMYNDVQTDVMQNTTLWNTPQFLLQ